MEQPTNGIGLTDDKHEADVVDLEALPKLDKRASGILTDCLNLVTSLEGNEVESASDVVDFRDIADFIGDEARQYDGQPLNMASAFSKHSKNDDWLVSVYQTNLDIDGHETPFGRLVIQISDPHFLTRGAVKLDFRRLGEEFILRLFIAKGGFQVNLDNIRGTMSSMPIPSRNKSFGVLTGLEKHFGDASNNLGTIQGLKIILRDITQ